MADESNPNQDHKKPLLNDEEFAELMAAEFAQERDRPHELGERRVWRKVESILDQEAPESFVDEPQTAPGQQTWAKPFLLWVAAAGIAAGIFSGIFFRVEESDLESFQVKSGQTGAPELQIDLQIMRVLGPAERVPITDGRTRVGEVLAFQAQSPRDGYLSLLVFANQLRPESMASIIEWQAGRARLFKAADEAVVYRVESQDLGTLRFCMMGAEDIEALAANEEKALSSSRVPKSAVCKTVRVEP